MKVGIIATGWIAEKAAFTLNGLAECEAYAVGSRQQETADKFAAKWNLTKAYGSYAELIADPDVDLVYIGTPHSHHYDVTKLALMAGKPCLVEKAFMANARQSADNHRQRTRPNLYRDYPRTATNHGLRISVSRLPSGTHRRAEGTS